MVTLEDIKKSYERIDEKLDRVLARHKYLEDAAADGKIEHSLDLRPGSGIDIKPGVKTGEAFKDGAEGSDIDAYRPSKSGSGDVGDIPKGAAPFADASRGDKPAK